MIENVDDKVERFMIQAAIVGGILALLLLVLGVWAFGWMIDPDRAPVASEPQLAEMARPSPRAMPQPQADPGAVDAPYMRVLPKMQPQRITLLPSTGGPMPLNGHLHEGAGRDGRDAVILTPSDGPYDRNGAIPLFHVVPDAPAAREVTLHATLRGEGLDAIATLMMNLTHANGGGQGEAPFAGSVEGTTGWGDLSINMQLPERSQLGDISIGVFSPATQGRVWIDTLDIELR